MTTRFCAQCGMLLEATAWYAGVCPGCGARVDVPRSALGPDGADAAEVATRPSVADTDSHAYALDPQGMPADGAATTPAQPPLTASMPVVASTPLDASSSRRAPSPWMIALIGVLVIALVGVSVYTLARRDPISIILAPFTASGASASSSSSSNSSSSSGGTPNASGVSGGTGTTANPSHTPNSGATTVPTTSATPLGTGTVSPEPTVSVTAVPRPTATASPALAALSVSPTSVTVINCLLGGGGQTALAVANTGGQPLTWSVSDNGNHYTFSVTGGTLDAGQQPTSVAVSHITGAIGTTYTVTFSAPGALNSPQTVHITCVV